MTSPANSPELRHLAQRAAQGYYLYCHINNGAAVQLTTDTVYNASHLQANPHTPVNTSAGASDTGHCCVICLEKHACYFAPFHSFSAESFPFQGFPQGWCMEVHFRDLHIRYCSSRRNMSGNMLLWKSFKLDR